MDIVQQLEAVGVVPVCVIEDAAHADPLADALERAGLPVMEITFRTAAAAESIRHAAARDGVLVGAGTVLSADQAKEAADYGARFIVSPGLDPETVEACRSMNLPVLPGVMTPTEIQRALALGLDVLKFFPAGAAGGVKMLGALSAPFGRVRFMPTGGVNAENLREYLGLRSVLACGGSWMVAKDLLAAGDFDRVTALAREARQIAEEVRGAS